MGFIGYRVLGVLLDPINPKPPLGFGGFGVGVLRFGSPWVFGVWSLGLLSVLFSVAVVGLCLFRCLLVCCYEVFWGLKNELFLLC